LLSLLLNLDQKESQERRSSVLRWNLSSQQFAWQEQTQVVKFEVRCKDEITFTRFKLVESSSAHRARLPRTFHLARRRSAKAIGFLSVLPKTGEFESRPSWHRLAEKHNLKSPLSSKTLRISCIIYPQQRAHVAQVHSV
jgi:hypothetical protein